MARWDEAERHFERALELNTQMESPPWVAHTRHDHALMLLRRGESKDEERGRELLEAACTAYEELGMTSWRARAEADLATV